jgi:osmotically-inducible protein OsmY
MQANHERVAADYAVRGLVGVKGVTNLISVKPPQTSPKDIKHRIEQAFERAADLDAEMISVEAKDGKVILRGRSKFMGRAGKSGVGSLGGPRRFARRKRNPDRRRP